MQFSPDGEIFASGSEDGTLRLWQTTVGKTYGKSTMPAMGPHHFTNEIIYYLFHHYYMK